VSGRGYKHSKGAGSLGEIRRSGSQSFFLNGTGSWGGWGLARDNASGDSDLCWSHLGPILVSPPILRRFGPMLVSPRAYFGLTSHP
jgi:hypothetical protein